MKYKTSVETADRRGPKIVVVCGAQWHKEPFKVATYNKGLPDDDLPRSVDLWLTDKKTSEQSIYQPGGTMGNADVPDVHHTETLECSRCAASGRAVKVMARREHLQQVFHGLLRLGQDRVTLHRLHELVERAAANPNTPG